METIGNRRFAGRKGSSDIEEYRQVGPRLLRLEGRTPPGGRAGAAVVAAAGAARRPLRRRRLKLLGKQRLKLLEK